MSQSTTLCPPATSAPSKKARKRAATQPWTRPPSESTAPMSRHSPVSGLISRSNATTRSDAEPSATTGPESGFGRVRTKDMERKNGKDFQTL